MRCLIVHHDTLGLRHDARILMQAIHRIRPGSQVHHLVLYGRMVIDYTTPLEISEEIKAAAPFDLTFLLEHAHPNDPILAPGFSKEIIYVPNIEWMNDLDENVLMSGAAGKVLLKNRYSFDVFSSLPLASRTGEIAFVGWTSDDPLRGSQAADKDFESFLHVKGISWQKQTDVVMETWAANPRFPPLTVVMRFERGFGLSGTMTYGKNVKVIMREIPLAELRSLQNAAGVHVNPSAAEGFGHSLNEARGSGSVLITTNAPPMNELVRHGENGLLAEAAPELATPMKKSRFYPVTVEALTTAVSKVLSMPLSLRREMGQAARASFLRDKQHFHERLAEVILR